MIQLYDAGVYLLHGTEIVESGQEIGLRTGREVSKEEAAKNTMAYRILEEHNTSGTMEKLQIRFDKLTSHDITFVGIIQTARASGLEKFPIPYVLTNCHNSLCAVGGTINEDDHMFGLKGDAGRRRKDDPWLGQPHPLRGAGNHGHGRRRSGAGKTASE